MLSINIARSVLNLYFFLLANEDRFGTSSVHFARSCLKIRLVETLVIAFGVDHHNYNTGAV